MTRAKNFILAKKDRGEELTPTEEHLLELDGVLHRAWTYAVGQPHYNKQFFREIEELIWAKYSPRESWALSDLESIL